MSSTEKVTPLKVPLTGPISAETQAQYRSATKAQVITLRPDLQRPPLVEMAVARMLADTESVSNWLAGECFDRTRVTSDYEARSADRLARADTATVFNALLEAADRGDVAGCMDAASLMVRRYLEEHDEVLKDEMTDIEGDLA